MNKISIVLPYLSNSTCIDICKKYLKQNTINNYELIEIIDETDVYSAYNQGVLKANCDVVILLNDDMFVSPGWDVPFFEHCKQNTVVTGYLVESGRIPVNDRNIEYNCGITPETFDYEKFNTFVSQNITKVPEIIHNCKGWYMPVAFHKKTFVEYPNEIKYPHPNDIDLFENILPKLNFNFIKVNSFVYHLQNYSAVLPTKKVIDCFPFFNEKELLELRINLLNDYVDQFIISELNYTHSGISKEFICKNLIEELNLPKEKIKVLEIKIDDNSLIPNEIDEYNSSESKSAAESKAWTRERIQRDAVLSIIDNYSDDTVFILSDCDEIIDPKYVEYFSSVCRNNHQNIIKVPLILFEGRADKRLFENNSPVPWQNSLLLCTAKQLKNGGTPTKMRSNVLNEYQPRWITEKNVIVQDCGWHFTWMGGEERRKKKADSFIHYANMSSVNTLSTESVKEIVSDEMYNQYEKRNYPVQLLPKIIFDLPRVKNFLLPKISNKNDIKNELINLYKNFDEQYGEWGWCSETKYNKIINCVLETCLNYHDPVCVEIGVYGGKSLFPFALALKQLNKGKVYGIDPWSNQEATIGYDHPSHKQFWSNVNLEKMYQICLNGIDKLGVNDYVTLFKSTSDEIRNIKNINVLHIDGQHTIQLLKDIINYATNIVKGGYCFIDDIEWSEDTLKAVELMKLLEFEKVDNINGCFVYKKL